MKLLVDENIPRMTVAWLRGFGHDVKDLRGTVHQGLSDSGLWALALEERRLLITTDKGFTEHRAESHSGILVVRLRQPNRLKIHSSVSVAMTRFGEQDWHGLLVVVRDSLMSVSRSAG